jgi:hypothetical protein
MRKIDDNIIHLLNLTIPTESFIGDDKRKPTNDCKVLREQVNCGHNLVSNLKKLNLTSFHSHTLTHPITHFFFSLSLSLSCLLAFLLS